MRRKILRFALLLVALGALGSLLGERIDAHLLLPMLDWLLAHRLYAGAILGLGVFVATVLLLPAFVFLSCSAGFLLGAVGGAIVVSLAATAGATVAFLIGAHFGFESDPPLIQHLREIDWKEVLLMRLCPFLPNRTLHYVFGAAGMPFRHFFVPTLIGTLPICIAYTWAGSVAATITSIEDISRSGVVQAFYVVAGLFVVAAASYLLLRAGQARAGRSRLPV